MIFAPELIFFMISAIMTLSLLLTVWNRRRQSFEKKFIAMLALAFIWTVFYILELSINDLDFKIGAAKIQTICAAFIPIPIILMIVEYNSKRKFTNLKKFLYIIPVVSSLITLLASMPNWFWGNPSLIITNKPFSLVDYDYGFWFYYIHVPYIYLVLGIALISLIKYFTKMQSMYRLQIVSIAIGLALPALAGILYVTGNSPVKYLNYTSAAFSVSCLVFFWALFRYRFLDLIPKARYHIFESLEDGIIVIDSLGRVLDFNPSAKNMTGIINDKYGMMISQMEGDIFKLIQTMIIENKKHDEISLEINNESKVYDIRLSSILEKSDKSNGSIITIRDYTEKAKIFNKILDQSIRDELTGIYNRRFVFEQGQKEINRMKRTESENISFAVIDMDNMKMTNDLFGHKTGDVLLKKFANICKEIIRTSDVFGRIGGDEFALIFPNSDIETASQIIKRIIEHTKETNIKTDTGEEISIVVSIGLISTESMNRDDVQIEKMIAEADYLMYEAKSKGGGMLIC